MRRDLLKNIGLNKDEALNQVEIAKKKESQYIASERLILEDPNKSEDERNSARTVLENLEIEEGRLQNRADYLERLKPLRERIKAIFKKYGFRTIAVISAVSVVIYVIVSNLTSGLSKMANGLTYIGKKIGNVLPGMIGAIASFIFNTAGEAISFLAKNAWLLIVAVVIYFVDQFKKNN